MGFWNLRCEDIKGVILEVFRDAYLQKDLLYWKKKKNSDKQYCG